MNRMRIEQNQNSYNNTDWETIQNFTSFAVQIFSVFGEAEIHLSDKAGMIKCLSIPSFTAIQCYRVDACMRDPHRTYFGPDWRAQRSPGQAAAALQHQRGGPKSRFAIGALLPRGLSKEEHELASRALVFPFSN